DTNPKVSSYSKIEDSYHYSGRIFKSTEMKNGSQSMPNYREVGNITGNSGDGYAKITSCYTKGEQC
ncbi:MAG: glycine-rich protein, partial [Bacilli bacterium]